MRDQHDRDLDAFATRIARPLRTAESLDATFERRVMSAVLAEAQDRRVEARVLAPPPAPALAPEPEPRGWWHRPRTVQVSPLRGLAIAAGIAAVAALGAMGVRSSPGPAPDAGAAPAAIARAAAPETVHVVRFVFTDPSARAVSLAGDFNGWSREATPLVADGVEGRWTVTVPVPQGRHEYAFVVRRADGEQWVADPSAARVRDEFGVESSLVTVGPVGEQAPAQRSI